MMQVWCMINVESNSQGKKEEEDVGMQHMNQCPFLWPDRPAWPWNRRLALADARRNAPAYMAAANAMPAPDFYRSVLHVSAIRRAEPDAEILRAAWHELTRARSPHG
ncbi:hypothetical protein EJB05_11612, partial [Eragrostis curvula]